jgi:hypothetical protein
LRLKAGLRASAFIFVQQSQTQNGPALQFSLLASGQGLTAISEGGETHFSVQIPATRPTGRGMLCSEADPRYDLRFMIYDLKAEGEDITTGVKLKPESSTTGPAEMPRLHSPGPPRLRGEHSCKTKPKSGSR